MDTGTFFRRLNPARLATLGLAPRLLLAAFPALIGTWVDGRILGPYWIYLWHPPLMDIFFGLLVLVPFIATPKARFLRAALLVVASILIHTCAVVAVVDTQWLFDSIIGIRFWTVIPIAVAATVLFAAVTAPVARLTTTNRYWIYACVAGLASGATFYVPLEFDESWIEWLWNNGLPWMVWHLSICTAFYFGREQPTAT